MVLSARISENASAVAAATVRGAVVPISMLLPTQVSPPEALRAMRSSPSRPVRVKGGVAATGPLAALPLGQTPAVCMMRATQRASSEPPQRTMRGRVR